MSNLQRTSRATRSIEILIVFMMVNERCFVEPSSVAFDQLQLDQRWHRESERRPLNTRFLFKRYHETFPVESLFPSWHDETPFTPVLNEDDYSIAMNVGNDNNIDDPATNIGKRVALDSEYSPRMLSTSESNYICESRYHIKDLGEGNYPRYLTESYCKPRTFQSRFHSCKVHNYTVYVLKKREKNGSVLNTVQMPETPLPESLRNKWQLKPISVAVACVSSSTNRRD